LEQSILNANAVVEFKTEVVDANGNPLPDAVTFSQRPSDVTAGVRVITIQDGSRPTVQFVGYEQEGKWVVFSELAKGADKTIADLVNKAIAELGPNWTATNPADSGAYGKAVHAKVREMASGWWNWATGESKRWKMGMLVNKNTLRIEELSGATQGIGEDFVELDAVYLEPGYNPKQFETLNRSRIIIYEIKTSASGEIPPSQLAKLQQIQGGDIRQIWSKLKWQQATNTLVENKRYTKALGLAQASNKVKLGLAVAGGVLVCLGASNQAMANFEAQVLQLRDDMDSGKSAFDIKIQEGNVKTAFKNLADGMSGGTSDEVTGLMLLDHVYHKMIPAINIP
jgi:hypothetical protein